MPKTSVIVSGAHTGSQRWKRATLPGGRPPPGFGAKPAGIHLASSADPPAISRGHAARRPPGSTLHLPGSWSRLPDPGTTSGS